MFPLQCGVVTYEPIALKLEYSGFAVENIIADCMELLLPMAAKKLDLSFDIKANVPPCKKAITSFL